MTCPERHFSSYVQTVAEKTPLLKQLDGIFMLLWTLLVIFAPVREQAGALTLLAPPSVFEGDSIGLICQEESNSKIKTMTYYKNKRELFSSKEVSNFPIQNVCFSDSGEYYCTATFKNFLRKKKSSGIVKIQVQELFPSPVLTASSLQPTEGSPVTLTCETQLPPQRSDVQLQFRFFRDGQALGSGWSSFPDLQIAAMWIKDSGSYWCEADTVNRRLRKHSLESQICVQRIPVSNVTLETQFPGGQVIEGEKLTLLCSVAKGTGNITFSWHREATGDRLGEKTQHTLSAELEIPAMKEKDAGRYYCSADNGHDPIQSKAVNVFVKIPVSRPVLTLGVFTAQAVVVGNVVELHCEALRGSPPILYWFYHENVTLGNSSAASGGGVSFNLSLTAEHSGNYSCEANNGLWAQRSETVSLSIPGSAGHRKNPITAKVLVGQFGVLGFVGVALLFYRWFHRMSGESSASNAASLNPQETTRSSPLPSTEELQPVYVNVGSEATDVIYSQVCSSQQPESSENTRRLLFFKDMDGQVIYSSVKKQ